MENEIVSKPQLDELLEFKKKIEDNSVVDFWENSDDYGHLAETTKKTMRYINDERIREFAQNLNATNDKILDLTFEGVKKYYDKQMREQTRKYRINLAIAFVSGMVISCAVIWVIFKIGSA